jgi:hypothetical protein
MAAINTNLPSDRTAPARYARAVTPSNSSALPDGPCRALFIGTGGDVTLIAAADDQAVLFKNLPDGSTLDVGTKQVKSTGTDATDIVALY